MTFLLFKVLALLALISISGALPSPRPDLAGRGILPDCATTSGLEACHSSRRSYHHEGPHRDEDPAGLTNAQRLVRRLPLKPPTRRSSARAAMVSPTPQLVNRGYIQIWSLDDSGNRAQLFGYVSRTTRELRQYLVQPSIDNALLVSLRGDRDLVTLNSDIPFPAFLGLVQGREDTSSGLAGGSSNYLYLASTEQTSPNATPQNVDNSGGPYPSESAVWTHDAVTDTLTANWVNPDGSLAPTNPFIANGNAIYFSGNRQQQQIEFVYVHA
ncbi:hypothetical protein B0H12DRAFT_1106186 [Mycena haematopus]|nr:hypothetical protein B0H12DRAFT_1106186 [Mycena haematopus]